MNEIEPKLLLKENALDVLYDFCDCLTEDVNCEVKEMDDQSESIINIENCNYSKIDILNAVYSIVTFASAAHKKENHKHIDPKEIHNV